MRRSGIAPMCPFPPPMPLVRRRLGASALRAIAPYGEYGLTHRMTPGDFISMWSDTDLHRSRDWLGGLQGREKAITDDVIPAPLACAAGERDQAGTQVTFGKGF